MSSFKGKQLLGVLLLLLAALIWGFAFVAQRVGMENIEPITFNAARSWVGVTALLPVIAVSDRLQKRRAFSPPPEMKRRDLLFGGLACGTVLTAAACLQQIGIVTTSSGKSGFLTALYIVLVPVLGRMVGRKTPPLVWISVGISLAGMYLLCVTEGFSFAAGDLFLIGCAFCFAIHILVIDRVGGRVDGIRLSCLQFFVCAVLSTAMAFLIETPTAEGVRAAVIPILFTGVFSSGIAYTLQIIGQQHCPPQIASLVMSLESVFAVLGGWLILRERLSARELVGCVLVFAAILLAQAPDLLQGGKKNSKT